MKGKKGSCHFLTKGEGQNPTIEHLQKLGKEASLHPSQIGTLEQTKHALTQWETLSENHGVSKGNIQLIQNRLMI